MIFSRISPNLYDKYTFGECIRDRREALGLSLRKTASMLEITPAYLSDIERGRRQAPVNNDNIQILYKLIEVLKIPKQEEKYVFDMAYASHDIHGSVRSYIENCNSIKELTELKELLNKRIKEVEEVIVDKEKLVCTDEILLQEVRKFCKENIKNVRVNPDLFDSNKLAYACYFEIDDKEILDNTYNYDIRVYQTLGMDRKNIVNYQNLGKYTINIYEDMLELYGLSIDVKLSNKEYTRLKKIHISDSNSQKELAILYR